MFIYPRNEINKNNNNDQDDRYYYHKYSMYFHNYILIDSISLFNSSKLTQLNSV